MRPVVLLIALLAACGNSPGRRNDAGDGGDSGPVDDAGGASDGDTVRDAAPDHIGPPPPPLGMNDVTFLLPLPATGDTPTLLRMQAGGEEDADLVPEALFTRLVTTPGDVGQAFGAFHVVAVRIDLCDRIAPGACPAGEDGRLRLVFQPITPAGAALDTALHGFYPIPEAEMPGVVQALRALSALQGSELDAPLQVSPALRGANPEPYAAALRALVRAYAKHDTLMRLTLFSQKQFSQISEWVLRGVVRDGDTWNDIDIPGVSGTGQHVVLVPAVGEVTYTVEPTADGPSGFALSMNELGFNGADAEDRAEALAALAQVDDPDLHTAETVQCVSCHVATVLMERRAAAAGIAPAAVPGRYASTYNLSIEEGASADDPVSLRALGWFGTSPKISQRVVNDTAQVLAEMEQRFGDTP